MPDPCTSPPNDPPTRVVELVVNLDDATGELVGDSIDQLLQHGALDAWACPITMKKGRPGIMLSALVPEENRDTFARLMLKLTGSFGVRFRLWDRLVLDRDWIDADTRLGKVKLKTGSLHGQVLTAKPEHDSVRALADAKGVTLAQAQRAAQAAADRWIAEQPSDPGPQGGPSHDG